MAETPAQRQDRHANEAIALEEELATIAVARLDLDVRNAGVSVIADFLRGKRGKSLTRLIRNRFRSVRPRVAKELTSRLDRAIALGLHQGRELAAEAVPRTEFKDPALNRALGQLDKNVRSNLESAIDLAAALPMDDRASVLSVLAKSHQAVTKADAEARWIAERAVSAGTAAAAKSVGANLLWVAERDGCLHCLAYAGQIVKPGTEFPHGLTFADKPLEPYEELWFPPLHPNCRCQVELTYEPVGTDDTLVREAQRSVARGLALAGEPARRRAADRLLNSDRVMLPKTVVARARRHFDLPVGTHAPATKPRKVAKMSTLQDFSLEAASGKAELTELKGGQSSRTQLAELPDGRQAVRKSARAGDDPESVAFLLDGEELLGALSEAIGAPVAKVHRSSPGEVWVEYIDGTTAVAELIDGPDGILIGLADVLSGYGDRATGLRNQEGRLRAFDNGGAWLGAELDGPIPVPYLREPNAPMRNWIGPDGQLRVPDGVTTTQLRQYRTSLVALRPVFAARGRATWLEYTLNVLDMLIGVSTSRRETP